MPDSFPESIKRFNQVYHHQWQTDSSIKNGWFLKQEYLPASRTTSGIGSLPLEKIICSLRKAMDHYWYDSEAIHELGLKEVARLTAEMEKVKLKWF
jgi:uncharacterized protein (DUF885 family)